MVRALIRRFGLGLFLALPVVASLNGQTATLQNPGLTPQQVATSFWLDTLNGWLGCRGSVLHTADGGATWREQALPSGPQSILSMHFLDKKLGWAVGEKSCVLRSNNGGETWENAIPFGLASSANFVYFRDTSDGWILCQGYRGATNLFSTTNGGASWNGQLLADADLQRISVVNDSVAIIVGGRFMSSTGRSGYAATTKDSGKTWQESDTLPNEIGPIHGLQLLTDSVGYCLGWFGIAKTIDQGRSWRKVLGTGVGGPRFECMHFRSSDTGFAYFAFGGFIVYKTANGGVTWNTTSEPGSAIVVRDVRFPVPSKGFAIGENGSLYEVSQTGMPQAELTERTTKDFGGRAVFSFKSLGCLGIEDASGSGLLVTENDGDFWRRIPVPVGSFTPLLCFGSNTIVAAGSPGRNGQGITVHRAFLSHDRGETWLPLTLGGTLDCDVVTADNIPASNGAAYLATRNPGKLFLTEDAGISWHEQVLPEGAGAIHFLSIDTGWICASSGLVKTTDGGRSWNVVTPKFLIDGVSNGRVNCIHFSSSSRGWIGGENSFGNEPLIATTNDGGMTWARQNSIAYLADATQPPPDRYDILAFCSIDSTDVWALDVHGLLHSEDKGAHWQEVALPRKPIKLSGLSFSGGRYLWVTGGFGGIWRVDTGHEGVHNRPDRSRRMKKISGVFSGQGLFDTQGRQVPVVNACNGKSCSPLLGSRILVGPSGTRKIYHP